MARLTERFFMGGNPTDVETLFIMESPGKCELVCNYACVGKTGNIMSKYLYSDDSVPLGCYLGKKLKKILQFLKHLYSQLKKNCKIIIMLLK